MGNKRVDTPLITITAMVRVGPWTVEQVHHGHWRKCDRCETDHKEVWVCTVDADAAAIASRLGGERTWRIGSTCGPTLMLVSDIEWAGKTKDLKRIVKLVVRAERVLAEGQLQGYNNSLVPYLREDLELLKKLELPRRSQRRMSSMLTFIERWLERKAEAAKAGAQPPPAALQRALEPFARQHGISRPQCSDSGPPALPNHPPLEDGKFQG